MEFRLCKKDRDAIRRSLEAGNGVSINRKFAITLSDKVLVCMRELRDKPGQVKIERLNSLILEAAQDLMRAPDQKRRLEISHRLQVLTDVRDLLTTLVYE